MKKKFGVLGTSPLVEPRVLGVRSNASSLTLDFEDGRSVRLPLVRYPRLFRATQDQRDHWQLIGPGLGVHWPDLDKGLSAEGLLAGRPSIEYLKAAGKAGAPGRSHLEKGLRR